MLYHDIVLFLHFVSLASGIGIGIANMFIARWAGEADNPDTASIMRSLLPRLAQISMISLGVLVVTGVLLLIEIAFGSYPWNQLWFWMKLLGSGAMVAVAFFVLQAQRQIKRGETPQFGQYLRLAGPATGGLGLLVVLFSAFAFH
ncbi:MAG: hypothetical protein ACTSWI_00935 [Alphaproteobacteria bacterium]